MTEETVTTKQKKPFWTKWWFWAIIAVVVFGAIGSFGDDDSEMAATPPVDETNTQASSSGAGEDASKTTEQTSEQNTASESTEKEIPGTIGMTPEEFKEAFNTASDQFDSNFKINNLVVEEGPAQDSFSVHLTDNLSLIGSVNKADGSIRDVLIIGQGDGSPGSGLDIITAMGILIVATNPELAPEERGKVLEDLGLFDENVNLTDHSASTVRNGIEYSINTSDELGIFFSAGDANDN